MSRPCVHVTLAEGPSTMIQLCEHCGALSIHAGPVTLRLDAASFAVLAQVVARAQAQLEPRRRDAPVLQ